ncbi:MAG: DegT/DnrJ/EryC1/StrS family aminotransferase, partial [Halobacteriovoraceae bacterium]|nr:DegT/DnrJ/EryC1/StrS family aminotransferase [Halobacteriovoraceae bacterium]
MNVSFFGNDRQFNNLKEEWMERASSVWSTGQFLFGPSVEKLEQDLARKTNRKYCVALASCTDALSIALHYLSLPVSSQVMVTNYSFLASATPILKNNLTPHFIDIDGEAFHPLTKEYRAAEADEAKAMIAVSLFGTPSDMGEIERFAEEKKIPLIEDAAQSFGSFNKGRPAGSFGFASCISFDPTKVLAASSSGGALLTDDERLFKFARQIRLHGKNQKGEFTEIGGKSLISSVEAELLNMKLEHLDGWLAR